MSAPDSKKRFGTAPVFFTAISTILGAILFLRFGFSVGTIGFRARLFAGGRNTHQGFGQG